MNSDEELTDILTRLQNDMPDSYCTGWVVVSEWVTSDGERKLAARKTPALTNWGAAGMLHHALYAGSEVL